MQPFSTVTFLAVLYILITIYALLGAYYDPGDQHGAQHHARGTGSGDGRLIQIQWPGSVLWESTNGAASIQPWTMRFHSTLPIPPVLEPPCETSNMLGPPLPRCALCNHQVDFLHTSGTLGTRERSHTWLLRCNHFIDPGCLGVIARPENGRVCCWPYFLFVIQGPNRNYSSYSESIISSNSNLPPVPT